MPAPALPLTELEEVLLNVSLTGTMLMQPLYAADGLTVTDFACARLNPAAQRLLRLPEQPAGSFLTLFPTATQVGVFAFYRDAFASGRVERRENLYQHDGLDGYYVLVAQRHAQLLVVSFTDSNEQSRSSVEQALRESQQREQTARAEAEARRGELERVFEQAPMAIAVYRGPQYTIELANATVARLWGRTREQLIGKGLFEALPEVAGLGFEELLDGVMATGTPYVAHGMEAKHERDGRLDTVYWDFVYVPTYAADGHIDGAMVVATDATGQVLARRQAEQLNHELEARVQERTRQLAEQQGLLSHILAQVPAALATLSGPEHRFSFVNDGYQRLVAGRAVLGVRVADALPEVVGQGFIGLLDQVYTSGEPYIGREVAITLEAAGKPATQHYLDFTYQPLTDDNGLVKGILAFAIDVTEQVRNRNQAEVLQQAMLAVARREAQHREELFQIFSQTPVAIILLREPDHRIDYFNRAFEALFPPDEWRGGPLRGHTLAEVYPRIREAGLIALLDVVYQTGQSQAVLDMPLAVLQPGSPRFVTFAYQAYQEQGRTVGVAAFIYDTTEQVLARQQILELNQELTATNTDLQASNQQLLHSNTDLDTFVYTASHDLKAPIANVEGLLEALQQELPPDVLQQALVDRILRLMQEAIARFQQTIGHLTTISQLQQTELVDSLDLAAIVEDVRQDLAPLLQATRATLTVDVDACPTVRSPAKTLRSVVYNLLSNALKYRAPDRAPRITIRCHREAGWTTLAVQDNGLGLSATQQTKLFTMFERLHTHVEGSGVGLYMVRRLVENAGGSIHVQSEPDVGSTFTVRLPV